MVSVYLDQAPWVYLAKARHGRTDGERFREALDVCRGGISMGLVEFPLSSGHYIETWRVGDPDRRRRLAETMIELSEARTMAKPPDLCDNELDAYIARIGGATSARQPWPVFGWGFMHAAGEIPDLPRGAAPLEMEVQHLADRPEGFLAHGGGHRDFGDLYRDGEEGLFAGLDAGGGSAELREQIVAASAVMEIHENIGRALDRAGLDPDALGPIGLAGPDLPGHRRAEIMGGLLAVAEDFISELPTREVAMRLRQLRHQNPEARWESNDMVDIAYLANAVVHCDVVVTEKQWVHELGRSGLLDRHGTRALADVAKLPATLMELTK